MASLMELPDINAHNSRGKSNQSSELRKTDKLKFQKLALIKSVDKFIKSNDLSSVIGRDNNYYPKQLEDQKRIDEVSEVHQNLNGLKRSCDDLKRKTQLKEKEIEKMRKDIDQMALVEDDFNFNVSDMEKRSKELDLEFSNTKQKQNDAIMTKKTYKQMLARMKKDSLIYQLRANTTEIYLNKNKVSLETKTEESQKVKENRQKANTALKDVIGGIEQQNHNREVNLLRFKDDLKAKIDVEKKREDRIKRQQEIAEVAANDIRDSNLKKWRKLLLVHRYLNQFLRLKMQREINKFSGVEQGFQKIKAATGVTDANEIVRKFLGREQTYSHLLISITEFEKKIQQLKSSNEELVQTLVKSKSEIENFVDRDYQDSNKDKYEDNDQDKIVAEIEEKALNSTLKMGKLTQWIEKNLTKLNRAGLVEDKFPEGNREGFMMLISILRAQLLTLQEEDQVSLVENQIKSQKEQIYESEFQKRNVRIKPSPTRQPRGSFSGEQSPSFYEEANESFEQMSKVDEEEVQNDEENTYFRSLREDLRTDARKKK